MPYVQGYLDNATFREVKKDAIDLEISIGKYVKDAVLAKLKAERAKRDGGAVETSVETKDIKQK